MDARVADSLTLANAWLIAADALPPGYFLSNLRHRSPRARWCASATLDLDPSGASISGFGPTPADALLALASKCRGLSGVQKP